MIISRPPTPELLASLTDREELDRAARQAVLRDFVRVTREELSARVATNIADEELAASLQASELADAHARQYGAGPSRRQIQCTPDPATPMDITPNATPIRIRTAPTSPTPAAAPAHTLRHFAAVNRAPREEEASLATAAIAHPDGQFNAQQHVAGPPPAFSPPQSTAVPVGRGRTARQLSAFIRDQMATAGMPPAYSDATPANYQQATGNASTSCQRAGLAPASRRTGAGPSTAQAGSSTGPPTYATNVAGTSFFVLPTRPSARNGFVAGQEVVRTATTFVDGNPCIYVFDSDEEEAAESADK